MKLLTVEWFFQARTGRLLSVFAFFVLVQVVFAALYFRLYKQRRDHFAFNGDILKSQRAVAGVESERSLAKLKGAIGALHEASSELDRGARPVVNGRSNASLELPSGRKCAMVFMSGPPAGGPAGSRLTIIDIDGKELLDADPTDFSFEGWLNSARWLATPTDWKAVIPRILKNLKVSEQDESRRLDSLSTTSPDIWSYWDFLYFSTIVQTTVGFGDILPNSTLIRMLVVMHILIGYALLIVVLNVVLGS